MAPDTAGHGPRVELAVVFAAASISLGGQTGAWSALINQGSCTGFQPQESATWVLERDVDFGAVGDAMAAHRVSEGTSRAGTGGSAQTPSKTQFETSTVATRLSDALPCWLARVGLAQFYPTATLETVVPHPEASALVLDHTVVGHLTGLTALRLQSDGAGGIEVELDLESGAKTWRWSTLDAVTGEEIDSFETKWSQVLNLPTDQVE